MRAIGCALGVSASDLEAIEMNQRGIAKTAFHTGSLESLAEKRRAEPGELRQVLDLCTVQCRR
jgi:hypothetical protein